MSAQGLFRALAATTLGSTLITVAAFAQTTDFDISRAYVVDTTRYVPFTLDQADRMPLRQALDDKRIHGETPLMIVEHPAGRIALSAEQMTYHHAGQGDFNGEPWMVSF